MQLTPADERIRRLNPAHTPAGTLLLLPLLLGSLLPTTALGEQQDGFGYQIVAGGAEITNYVGAGVFLTIPDQLGGQPVTSLAPGAFGNVLTLRTVKIPASVTSIAPGAFGGCVHLAAIDLDSNNPVFSSYDGALIDKTRSLLITCPEGKLGTYVVPDTVTAVEAGAFGECVGLTSITIPESVTSIGAWAFYGCPSLARVTLRAKVTRIDDFSFTHCDALRSVVLPEALIGVGDFVFMSCSNLTDITLPPRLVSIGSSAFKYCASLTNITLPASLTNIGSFVFDGCASLQAIVANPANPIFSSSDGVLFNRDQSWLIKCPEGKLGTLIIPRGIAGLDYREIAACNGLTAIEVDPLNPDLSSVDGVLFNKDQTTFFVYPAGKMGGYTIPATVTASMGSEFDNCTHLTSLTIPANFPGPSSVSLSSCSNLLAIEVDPNHPQWSSIDGVLLSKDRSTLLSYPHGRVGPYTPPDKVTALDPYSFRSCPGLTQITIPSGVTSIGSGAFDRCSGLSSIDVDPLNPVYRSDQGVLYEKGSATLLVFPGYKAGAYVVMDATTRIDEYAFYWCSRVTSVTVPASVTSISQFAFLGCRALTSVIYLGPVPPDALQIYESSPFVTSFYPPGATRWGPTFWEHPTAVSPARTTYADWSVAVGLQTSFPNQTAASDDPDGDGLTNGQEWMAGTDPARRESSVALELTPRPDELSLLDTYPLPETQQGIYGRTVPGRYYGVQTAPALTGPWTLGAALIARTNQTRFVLKKPTTNAYFRALVLP